MAASRKALAAVLASLSALALVAMVIVAVTSDEDTVLRAVKPWVNRGMTHATVTVYAVSAVTNKPVCVDSAELQSRDGTTQYKLSDNSYCWSHGTVRVVAPVDYRAVGQAKGFAPAKAKIVATAGGEVAIRLLFVPLAGVGDNAQAYIVLRWGVHPVDIKGLNGILHTPSCTIDMESPRRCDVDPHAVGIHDDVNEHGPDVIAITKLQPGQYVYEVNRMPELNPVQSDARVTLYMPHGKIYHFRIARNGFFAGTNWKVFKITDEHGEWGQVLPCLNEHCSFGRSD
mmetsp:Transcript_29491/g.68348  ORF Transcript_29491/g.68348 Transcript_29491/m.68348 type:complete len:285 (-) Transcript_29491:81-935(-)